MLFWGHYEAFWAISGYFEGCFLIIALFSFFHVVRDCGVGGGWVVFLVISVSHPTLCCVGVGVVVEVGVRQ